MVKIKLIYAMQELVYNQKSVISETNLNLRTKNKIHAILK